MGEENRLPLRERPANPDTAAVVVCGGFLDLVSIIVPGVGVQRGVLMQPIHGAMVCVSSALADDSHLAARRTEESDVFVGDLRAKLVHTPHADRYDGLFGGTAGDHVVCDVYPVHNDTVLIAARSGNGAAIIPKTNLGAVVRSRSVLAGQKLAGIAAQGSQAHQPAAAHHLSHTRLS